MSNFSMDNIHRAVDNVRRNGLGDFLFQEPTSNRGRSNRCRCSDCNRRRTSRRPQTSRRVNSNCCSCRVVSNRRTSCNQRQSDRKRCTSRNQRNTNRGRSNRNNQRNTNRGRGDRNNQRPSNSNGCNKRRCGGVYRRNSW